MKKIFTSILTLVLMTVVLGTGVYAWFTINTKTTADGLEGTAETVDGGFLIALTETGETPIKEDWGMSVTLGGNLFKGDDKFFTDLTSDDGIVMKKIDGTTHETGYVEFDLHFLTGETMNKINLNELSINSTKTSWVSEVDLDDIEKGDVMDAYLADAIRVSIEESGSAKIFEKGEFEDNTIGLSKDNFAAKYYKAINGENSLDTYNVPTRTDIALDEEGIINELIATANGTITHEFGDAYSNYAKVTVRVWLEGWDGQAFNAVAGGSVTVNFEFEVKES